MLWLLRSSPMDVKAVFWSKFWVGTIPLLAVTTPVLLARWLALDVNADVEPHSAAPS